MPEDVAYISSKSAVNTLRDSKVMSAARIIADRQMTFHLYIVNDLGWKFTGTQYLTKSSLDTVDSMCSRGDYKSAEMIGQNPSIAT